MSAFILVLAGGPDAERAVSLKSATAVAHALGDRARLVEIDTIGSEELAALPGEIVLPILHGPWGEGGPMQDLLAMDGRPYLGCGPIAARLAMDKLATKLIAAGAGVPTPVATVLDVPRALGAGPELGCPVGLPCVVKPVHEGSSVGVHVCRTSEQWRAAVETVRLDRSRHPDRVWMVEAFRKGREVTIGLLGDGPNGSLRALTPVEITPASGVYDYEAKYQRSDTVYTVGPELPPGLGEQLADWALRAANGLGVRHLARVDFIVHDAPSSGGAAASASMLEVNTMPGFTATSLFPKAARASGLDFEALIETLVELVTRDGA